jgi:hypothetical protein
MDKGGEFTIMIAAKSGDTGGKSKWVGMVEITRKIRVIRVI